MSAPLEICDLTVGYSKGFRRSSIVLRDVSGTVHAGELVALVGPNGSGKSTLLRSIAGLQKVFSGTVAIDGEPLLLMNVTERARKLAVVLTDRFDADRLRVRDVVAMGRHPYTSLTGRLCASDYEIVDQALADVGVEALVDVEMAALSDGQRQRVMVARALAQEPSVLLLDEPTSFLDPPGKVSLATLIRKLCTERELAAIICTHDIEGVLPHADSLWVVDKEGHVAQGRPKDLVADGVLGEAFATPGVRFDQETLTFKPG